MVRAEQALILLMFGILGAIFLPRVSFAYNEDGHFYALVALYHAQRQPFMEREKNEATVAAFCAQIADLAKELEAVTLRYDAGVFGTFSCATERSQHMYTAHEYIHALTDSAAEPVTDAAVSLIRRFHHPDADPNTACAMGLALHLPGDSFAHRRLAAPARTYAPGLGHARDGHDPDYIAFNRGRADLWLTYASRLAEALELNIDAARWGELADIAARNLGGTEDNLFNTDAIISGLMGSLGHPSPDQTPLWAPYKPPFEHLYENSGWFGRHIIQRSFDEVVSTYKDFLPSDNGLPDYRIVWKIYMKEAVPEFETHGIRSVCRPQMEIQ